MRRFLILILTLSIPYSLHAKGSILVPCKDTIVIKQISLPSKVKAGQHIETVVQVNNWGKAEFSGSLVLEIKDAASKSVDGWFKNIFPVQYFTVAVGETESISFPFDVPHIYKGKAGINIEAFDLKGNSLSNAKRSFLVKGNRSNIQDSKN